ncbi:PaaI family thioesterase [Paucibacter sp. PLA-PC-4]|uniref:PaaI family thioesterase n=1 Tax=Paucibacter sp. PLA-PC-4 TaxID=2993655 RepID=UPI002248D4E1|nr:PaaI family thioesterase [Paucibacter sp. PLA-PC-4]MCX2861013.1 PaaI family thioesterase [Paucibacter sp. PLA-PC-4]
MSNKSPPPLNFPVHIPFVEQLGLELHSMGEGEAELRVDLKEAHLNSWEVAHGGVIMTLLDVAMAHAARSIHRDQPGFGPGVVTIEMKTSFMRPGEGELRALGKLLHRSTTMAFCEGSVLGEDGKLCAHATGTFKYLKALPGRGRSLKTLQRSEG